MQHFSIYYEIVLLESEKDFTRHFPLIELKLHDLELFDIWLPMFVSDALCSNSLLELYSIQNIYASQVYDFNPKFSISIAQTPEIYQTIIKLLWKLTINKSIKYYDVK